MIEKQADGRDFLCFKSTALKLSKALEGLFDEEDTPILIANGEIEFESDEIRIIVRFEKAN